MGRVRVGYIWVDQCRGCRGARMDASEVKKATQIHGRERVSLAAEDRIVTSAAKQSSSETNDPRPA